MEELVFEDYEPDQRSEEWFQQRLGKFTASTFGDCMGSGRAKDAIFTLGGYALIREKITELLTGDRKQISGDALDWGTYNEEFAIQTYEDVMGLHVVDSPFCPIKGFEDHAGGSPDGFIEGENGIIEVKCPYLSNNHVDTLIDGTIQAKYWTKYYTQIQFNILATETDFCDFISFDPRMVDPEHQIKIIRIERDDEYIEKIKERLELAIKERDHQLEVVNKGWENDNFINQENEDIL